MTRVVVIGNGMAGARLVDDIAVRDPHGRLEVTVLGAESSPAYNRILLSDVVAGKSGLEDIRLAAPPPSPRRRVRTGVTVTAIDRERGVVVTDRGTELRWDRLVLATGSNPFLPPLKGLLGDDGTLAPGVTAFRTIEDSRALIAAAGSARRAVVLGGGLLGIEAARGLAQRGVETEILHGAGHLMNRQLDAAAGRMLARSLADVGIGTRLRARACAVRTAAGGGGRGGSGLLTGVELDDGSVVPADLLVVATGVRPETILARRAGLAVDRGVLVDDSLRSETDDRIHAIGECAQHAGAVYGLVAPAWEQAGVVADLLTGSNPAARYRGSDEVVRLKAAGLEVAAMGEVEVDEDEAEVVTFLDPVRRTYKKVVIREERLVGAVLVGDLATAGTLTQLFDRGGPVPADRLSLLFPQLRSSAAGTDEDPSALPDSHTVCRCNGVTKGAIAACWLAGAGSTEDVVARTRATTGCGGCHDTVAGIVRRLATAQRPELEPFPATGICA